MFKEAGSYQIQITLIILDLQLAQNYSVAQMTKIIIQIMLLRQEKSHQLHQELLKLLSKTSFQIVMQELNKDKNPQNEMLTKILELN